MEGFGPSELERFRNLLAGRLGLHIAGREVDFLATILKQRLHASKAGSVEAYLESLESSRNHREELRALASHLTVTETYFLRNPDHFRAVAEVALPERLRARAGTRQLRLLSAGCASGEEAYSLAILALRCRELAGWDLRIVGLDVDPVMIEKARQARYPVWSLRETPAEIREAYFRPEGPHFVLHQSVRSMVCFEERNLAEDGDLGCGEFDLIFCRNVIMYLTAEAAHRVIERLTRALAPAGFLFLGHAETLRGLSPSYHLRHTHDTFYYQKKEQAVAAAATGPWAPSAEPSAPPAGGRPEASWMNVIQQSTERIEGLSRKCGQPLGPEPGGARPAAAPRALRPRPAELGRALELLRQERFAHALEVLRGLPPESGCDPDTQLLRAILLTNRAELILAEAACRQLLAVDDLNAGAHYLTALCRERAGDPERAREHDRMAKYLDPAFAMPYLHLGLLAKRAGDLGAARAELEQAALLLQREEPSRILLFGGGFSREALLALTRTELRTCGGPA